MNVCIDQLLRSIHGVILWINKKVEIPVQLILHIIGLPIQGEDPKNLFSKENEKIIMQYIYEKYMPCKEEKGGV